jgi:ATP-dependent DNA helicase RecG
MKNDDIQAILDLGEGQTIEFKESLAVNKLDREIVAFANASGGDIYCGVSDSGKIMGVSVSNAVKSQIQDIARNCDPPVAIKLEVLTERILKIHVPESVSKPHQCASGFYLRIGSNSQKLRVSEVKLIMDAGQSSFDSRANLLASFQNDFDDVAYSDYCASLKISRSRNKLELLRNMHAVVKHKKDGVYLSNTGVLLFTKCPRDFIPESYLTAVCYGGTDKFSVLDRKEFTGNLIDQVESGLAFAKKHIAVEYEISGSGARKEYSRFPLLAVREALINALTHRDYSFQNSCVYLNIYTDRLEIENPGGIAGGQSADDIEGRSVRRNPILADLLFRAGYGEKLGSGLIRIKEALRDNQNPNYQIAATNFFSIRLLPRIAQAKAADISSLQMGILSLLGSTSRDLSSAEIAAQLGVSSTTITRQLKRLIDGGYVATRGIGKAIRYRVQVK